MLATLEQIDESIEHWAYPLALKQIKKTIHFAPTTEESLKKLNDKLLKCLDLANFSFHKKIREIENIIDDKSIYDNLNSEQKALLYINLWDNFFELWEMEDSLLSYYNRLSLWNKQVLKQVIYMSIYLHLSDRKDEHSRQDAISHIIEDLEKNEDLLACVANIKSDILRFFYWDMVLSQAKDNLHVELYNLEALEITMSREAEILTENMDTIEMQKKYYSILDELDEKYEALYSKYNQEVILQAKENMIKRFHWNFVKYVEYWNYVNEFMALWFGMNNVYLKSNNPYDLEKSISMMNFLSDYGLKNLDLSEKSNFIYFFHKILTEKEDLEDYYLDSIKKILYKNFVGLPLYWTDIVLLSDLFLLVWDYESCFNNIKVWILAWIDLTDNIKELLNNILLNKDFYHLSDFELQYSEFNWKIPVEYKKMQSDPEICIPLLLEKLELWKKLNEEDYNNIESLCKY